MSKELTKGSISEFKNLKKWVVECPIEVTMRIQELEQQVEKYKVRLETIATYINIENELDIYRIEGSE